MRNKKIIIFILMSALFFVNNVYCGSALDNANEKKARELREAAKPAFTDTVGGAILVGFCKGLCIGVIVRLTYYIKNKIMQKKSTTQKINE